MTWIYNVETKVIIFIFFVCIKKARNSKYYIIHRSLVFPEWFLLVKYFIHSIDPCVSDYNILTKHYGIRVAYRIIYPMLPHVRSNIYFLTIETTRYRFAYMWVCVLTCLCVCLTFSRHAMCLLRLHCVHIGRQQSLLSFGAETDICTELLLVWIFVKKKE